MPTWSLRKKLDPVLADARETMADVRSQADLVGVCLVTICLSLLVIAAAQLAMAVRGDGH